MLSTPWLPVPVCKALACARWPRGGGAAADTAPSRLLSSPCSPTVAASKRLLLQSTPSLLARSACPPFLWLEGERGGNPFRLLLNCCLYDNDFFPHSLSLSFHIHANLRCSLFADRFQTIASCRLAPFVPLSCSAFSTQAGVLPVSQTPSFLKMNPVAGRLLPAMPHGASAPVCTLPPFLLSTCSRMPF